MADAEGGRIDYARVAPGAYEAVLGLEKYLARERFDPKLLHWVKSRASVLNGCAHCLEMHAKDATAEDGDPVRLDTPAAWEETPLFTPKERAALRRTDAVTQVSEGHVPDAVYEEARKFFDEKELLDLTMAVLVINAWNGHPLPLTHRELPAAGGPGVAQNRTRSSARNARKVIIFDGSPPRSRRRLPMTRSSGHRPSRLRLDCSSSSASASRGSDP